MSEGNAEVLERQPGQNELRWRQLVAEELERSEGPDAATTSARSALADRVVELEQQVAELTARLDLVEGAISDLL